jgi:hypothetical protein
MKYNDVFCSDVRELIVTNLLIHNINVGDSPPVPLGPHRTSATHRKLLTNLYKNWSMLGY